MEVPTIRPNETEDEFRTRIHRAMILLVEYRAACHAAAEMLRGAAHCFRTADPNATLWDTAAAKYTERHARYRAELAELGVELSQGEVPEEWPELFQ